MSLEEYEKISISSFKGLYSRGLDDSCPPDHAIISQNLCFDRNGDTFTRSGIVSSLPTSHRVARMFTATFNHNPYAAIVLTCDGAGNIYRSDTGGVLLSVTNMVDFTALNIYDFCLISPILSTYTTPAVVYIWSGRQVSGHDAVPIRPAAGVGPGLGMTATENSIAGNCDIGVHQIAVSFITNTGYTTQPGPLGSPTPATPENPTFASVSVTSTGSKTIEISNIPIGPSSTTARQILLTQADLNLFYYAGGQIWNGTDLVPWDGVINDNTTTSIIISFFDTDLAVSADSLFDLLPSILAGNNFYLSGITVYHGRTLFWGGEFNLVRVSFPGSAESIDNVKGFIQLSDQFDSNVITNACTLQDVLYFFKQVGIFSVTDNGSDPDTWNIITVDSGVGCSSVTALGTVNLSTPANTQNQVALLTDSGGVYLFNGAVIQPPLTWKINDLWINIYQYVGSSARGILEGVRIAVDPYSKLIYIAILGNSFISETTGRYYYPNLLVADYNDGLDSQNIKWSIWGFPDGYYIGDIGMMYFLDAATTPELAYRLRIAFNNTIYKILPGTLDDDGNPIVCIWRSYLAAPKDSIGALNIFRFIRSRIIYKDTINITLFSQDGSIVLGLLAFNPPYTPGRDIVREFNFMNEKCAVQICCNAVAGGMTLQRLDLFGKARFNMRPSV